MTANSNFNVMNWLLFLKNNCAASLSLSFNLGRIRNSSDERGTSGHVFQTGYVSVTVVVKQKQFLLQKQKVTEDTQGYLYRVTRLDV